MTIVHWVVDNDSSCLLVKNWRCYIKISQCTRIQGCICLSYSVIYKW